MLNEDEIEARLERQRLAKPFPEELAKDDPMNYWIDPKDGLCKKRGKEQFLINQREGVIPVTQDEFTRKKEYQMKQPSKGEIELGNGD